MAESTNEEFLSKLEQELGDLRTIANFLSDPDFLYRLRKYAAGYNLLLTRYARFKVGDRVRLARTPIINETVAPGWIGSKHFLVKGACGRVKSSDVRPDSGTLYYGIIFDNKTWRDWAGWYRPVENPHVYIFGEDMLEAEVES